MAITTRQRMTSAALAVAVVGSVVASTAAGAVSTSSNTTVTAVIAGAISIDSLTPTNVTVNLTPTGTGVVSSASQAVQVSTNNSSGFKLYLKDANADLTLGDPGGPIAAHTGGTLTVPTALANNTWGFAIPGAPFDASYSAESNNASSVSKWAGITASDQQLKNVGAAGTNTTTVWYGVRATTATNPGSYADIVTYTATTNP